MPKTFAHHLHFPHFKLSFDNSHNLRMLYGIRVVRELKNNFAFFFLSLYFFELGPRISFFEIFALSGFQKGMLMLGVYYIIYRLMIVVLGIPLGKLIATKIGFKNSFVISSFLAVSVLLLLKQSVQIPELVFIAALLDGLETIFFWPSFMNIFGGSSTKKRMGEDLGLLQFMLQLGAMVSPALGGLVATILGYDSLFLIGLAIAMVAVVFAVGMRPGKIKSVPSWKEFWKWSGEKQFRKLSLTFVGKYVNDSIMAIWPLYIFLILGTIDKVGFLYSLSLFVAMLLSFFIGFYIDHSKNKKPFFVSGGFLSLLWFMKTSVFSVWSITAVNIADKLLSSFHWLFYDSLLFKRSKGSKSYSFFMYREIIIALGGIAFWLVFIGLFLLWGDWKALFVLAAFAPMTSLLMSDKFSRVK